MVEKKKECWPHKESDGFDLQMTIKGLSRRALTILLFNVVGGSMVLGF
jgi:hypothetical protein